MAEVNKHWQNWNSVWIFLFYQTLGQMWRKICWGLCHTTERGLCWKPSCAHLLCITSRRFIFINCTMMFLLWRVMPLFASGCVVCTQQVCVHNKLLLWDMERGPVCEIWSEPKKTAIKVFSCLWGTKKHKPPCQLAGFNYRLANKIEV